MSKETKYIKVSGFVSDEFAVKKDKRKAYAIISFSVISGIALTALLYFL